MRLIDLAAMVLVQMSWGFHFALSKIGMHEIPPLLFMGLRFAIVAAILCPFWRPQRGKLLPILGLSVTLGSLNFGLLFAGVSHLDAGTSAIIVQAQVPLSAILAAYFYHERFGWRRLAGLTLSFFGVVMIVGEPRVGQNLVWVGCVLGSALAASIANVQVKSLGPINPLTLTGWMALFTAPQLLAASLLVDGDPWPFIAVATWRGWTSLGYTVFIVAIASWFFWFPLLRRHPLNQVMPLTLLQPVFGVISGVLLLDEALSLQLVLGGIATVCGVAIILFRPPSVTAAPPPTRPPAATQESLSSGGSVATSKSRDRANCPAPGPAPE
jgi:O-acetylserine/cysteine efflux transporter